MSERKGINKYYPPDWDPSKVPKRQKTGNQDIKIRLMAPFSMRCVKCNEYIAKSRKFNAKKEVTKEMYMSIKIIRFHITCPRCNNKIIFKTSPQTAGYAIELGAVRNHVPANEVGKDDISLIPETEEEILARLEKEEMDNKSFQKLKEKRKKNPFWKDDNGLRDGSGDVMENLEKRLLQQQKENELNEHLVELHARQDYIKFHGGNDKLADNVQEKIESQINDIEAFHNYEDEQAYQQAMEFHREKRKLAEILDSNDTRTDSESKEYIKVEETKAFSEKAEFQASSEVFKPKIIVKRKRLEQVQAKPITSTSISSLADYSSDDDSE